MGGKKRYISGWAADRAGRRLLTWATDIHMYTLHISSSLGPRQYEQQQFQHCQAPEGERDAGPANTEGKSFWEKLLLGPTHAHVGRENLIGDRPKVRAREKRRSGCKEKEEGKVADRL